MIKNILKINFNSSRIFGLDILRFFAIVFVVASHGVEFLPTKIVKFLDYFILDGVSIFFVLSGYLIGGILIKEITTKEINFKLLLNFWQRRWFRTLPNYFFVLSLLIILHSLISEDFELKNSFIYFIFSQNIASPHPNWFPEAWSLCVEEWFYLIIPLAILGTLIFYKSKNKNIILFYIFFFIILITLVRIYKFNIFAINTFDDWDNNFRKEVITRLDSLMYGFLGAFLSFFYNLEWKKHKNISFIIGLLLLITPKIVSNDVFDSLYNCVFSFSINSLGTLLILPFLCEIKSGKGVIYRGITILSLISYSMYLINLSIVQNTIVFVFKNQKILSLLQLIDLNTMVIGLFKYMLFWTITITGSILMFKYIEVPTTKLRDKFN